MKQYSASVVCIAISAFGCSSSSEQFFIVQNQVADQGCVVSASRSSTYRGSGVLDVGLVFSDALVGYRLLPLLQNDLPARGQGGGTEPNRISLREFRVRVLPGAGAPQALVDLFAMPTLAPYVSYSEAWSGSVDPGGGVVSAAVTVVPAEVAHQISATGILDALTEVPLIVRVRAIGNTLGDTVESREFEYPIRVCKYCLVASVVPCPHAAAKTGDQCNIAQDTPVDCCSDGSSLVCPSRAPSN